MAKDDMEKKFCAICKEEVPTEIRRCRGQEYSGDYDARVPIDGFSRTLKATLTKETLKKYSVILLQNKRKILEGFTNLKIKNGEELSDHAKKLEGVKRRLFLCEEPGFIHAFDCPEPIYNWVYEIICMKCDKRYFPKGNRTMKLETLNRLVTIRYKDDSTSLEKRLFWNINPMFDVEIET